jgi:predicted SAM-dependent methyltransferase
MWLNGKLYKAFRHPKVPFKVQLGCGQSHYIKGWVNVDANIISAKPDLWINILNPLPFRDSSVAAFYSYHVIEHLPDPYLPVLLKDLIRCLIPGGWVRLGGPDAENAARKFIEGDLEWFSDFPDKHASIGGRFTNLMICRGEHLTLLSESYLAELLAGAGFVNIQRCAPARESSHNCSEVLAEEWEDDLATPHSIVVEASKSLGDHPKAP